MNHYIIQVLILQALFFLLYELVLKKETFFKLNRAYLLVAQLVVIGLPFININVLSGQLPKQLKTTYVQVSYNLNRINNFNALEKASTYDFNWMWVIYFGMVVSFALFGVKFYHLINLMRSGNLINKNKYKLILLSSKNNAFSFLNFICIGNNIDKEQQQQIIAHELVHVQQKHTLDLLFFELVRILFWYNPFVYLFQKRITEIHEFLVDDTLTRQKDKKQYARSIINEIFNTQTFSLTNSYSKKSLIAKRMKMIFKEKSKKSGYYKYLTISPVILIAVVYVACSKNDNNFQNIKPVPALLTAIHFETGPMDKCLEFVPQFSVDVDNFLKIINTRSTTDAVVKLVALDNSNKKEQICRIVFIKANEIYVMKNIPPAKYFLKITYGNEWMVPKSGNDCMGYFAKNEQFELGEDTLDFNIVKTASGIDVPSYELSLSVDDEQTN
ncbi:M56 family metallopeptidase [Aquimarina agarivorans]|uniref:M56 family metallopeptidase n=1 Tax=Aquimarina agarivorans TaxID=980584 RepID=UPI000248F5D8|nr:M56 family metallopeptidase [Aquimarina agarivorans]